VYVQLINHVKSLIVFLVLQTLLIATFYEHINQYETCKKYQYEVQQSIRINSHTSLDN